MTPPTLSDFRLRKKNNEIFFLKNILDSLFLIPI